MTRKHSKGRQTRLVEEGEQLRVGQPQVGAQVVEAQPLQAHTRQQRRL